MSAPDAERAAGAPSTIRTQDISYVLPLRSEAPRPELAPYLRDVSDVAQVIVVDGSGDGVFAEHDRVWPGTILHVRVDADLRCANGKVAGVLTGLRHAGHEAVVIADDDVRYAAADLRRIAAFLTDADVVVPQNYFAPLPWHARWDTARTLLNRAVGHDYPGTLAVRRSTLLSTGGYDGSVLFENLELMRTVEAAGGRIRYAPDLHVLREPPATSHFVKQRVRQAYDSSAQPGRLAVELCLLPGARMLFARFGPASVVVLAGAAIALAEVGRRRDAGTRVFPPSTSLYAPAWLTERALCAWIGQAMRLRGGVRYGDTVLFRAAHSVAELRAAGRVGSVAQGRAEDVEPKPAERAGQQGSSGSDGRLDLGERK